MAVKGKMILPKGACYWGVWHSGQITNGVLESLVTLFIDPAEL